MADITKKIQIEFQVNNSPVQKFEGTLDEVLKKVQEVEDAISTIPEAELKLKVDGVEQTTAELKQLSQQAKSTEKAMDGLGQENGDLSKSFSDIYGEAQPLTGKLGELEDRLYELALAGKQGSEEFKTLTAEAGRYRQAQIQTDLAVDAAAKTFADKLGGALQGVASGFAIAQGAAGLFGEENENVEKALLKVQSALALVQGISAFRQAIPDIKAFGKSILDSNILLKANQAATKATAVVMGLFSKSVNTTSTSFKLLKGAIAATGIGLLVVAVGELVANWDKISAAISGTTEKQVAYNNVMKETLTNSSAEIASLDSLYEASQDLTKSMDERRAAAIKLQETYPQTFSDFTQEEILAGRSADAYKNLRNEIVATALTKAKQAQIDAKAAEINEQDVELLERINKLRQQQKTAPEKSYETTKVQGGQGGAVVYKETVKGKADIEKDIQYFEEQRKKLQKQLQDYAEEIGAITAPAPKTAEQKQKEAAANITKGEIEQQKQKIERLKAQGKETLNEQLSLAKLELKLLQQTGQATTKKENEIESLKTQIKKAAADKRAELLKNLAEKEKKIYDDSVAALEATYNKEKATLDKQLEADLNAAKTVEQKLEIQKKYTAAVKQLDENLVNGKFDALAKLQEGDKLTETQQKEKSAQLTNIQTEYNRSVKSLDNQLAAFQEERDKAEEERLKSFEELKAQYGEQDLDNLADKLQRELDLIEGKNLEELAKAKELRLQLLAIEKQKALDAEKARSGGVIEGLEKAKEEELKLYEEGSEEQLKIAQQYDDQIALEKAQNAENVLAITQKFADAAIDVEKNAKDKKVKFADLERDEKIAVIEDYVNKTFELVNGLNDVLVAIDEARINRIEEQAAKEREAKEKENEKELSNLELTEEQRTELQRQQALELEKIEEDKAAKIKAIQKKQADVELAITIAQIIANTALAAAKATGQTGVGAALVVPLIYAQGAIQLGTAIAQRAAIQGYARGGFVSGPGGPEDDLIPALLSDGESVINAAATRRFAPILSAINESTGGAPIRPPRFAAGGVVSANPGEVSITNIQDIAAVTGQAAVRAYILQSDVTSESVKNARIIRDSRIK